MSNQNSGNKIGNTDPISVPQESHGGNNARSAPKPHGNGAQKRQQQKKTN